MAQVMQKTPSPARCAPGLEFLIPLDQVIIQQQVELAEAILGIETSNRYVAKNATGQFLYNLKEDSGHGDTITARDLLQVLQEKDRLLSTLLERLTVAGAAQPQPAPTFQVIPDLSHNISAFDGSEDAPSAREWIDNIRRTSNLHG
ncbi:hypothetical protein MTO96_049186 [Rhipicephalus appendiculatus]